MNRLLLTVTLLLTSCASQVERFELPPRDNYIYYETADATIFMEMVLKKTKDSSLIHDPSICLQDKSKLPQKKHILEDLNTIGADSVLVINVENSNGRLENKDGSYKFGYKKGYYCKSAAFFKKNESK